MLPSMALLLAGAHIGGAGPNHYYYCYQCWSRWLRYMASMAALLAAGGAGNSTTTSTSRCGRQSFRSFMSQFVFSVVKTTRFFAFAEVQSIPFSILDRIVLGGCVGVDHQCVHALCNTHHSFLFLHVS